MRKAWSSMKLALALVGLATSAVLPAQDAPRFWPKANIPIVQPRQRVAEPPVGPPPSANSVYWLLCKERPNLYWFTADGRHGALSPQAPLRSPVALTHGPGDRVLVLDLPVRHQDPALLWAFDREGHAQVIGRWPRDEGPPTLKWPSQIVWNGRELLIGDQDAGVLAYTPGGRLRALVEARLDRGRFGAVALAPDGRLWAAHGYTVRSRGNLNTGIRVLEGAGEVWRLDPRGAAAPERVLQDDGARLWFPRAMARLPDGSLAIVDEGRREKTRRAYTGARPSNVTETHVHRLGSLLLMRQGRLDDVPVQLAGHPLQHPWNVVLDRDGRLLVADPAMPDPQGRGEGVVMRVRPDGSAQALFSGRPWCQPLAALPR